MTTRQPLQIATDTGARVDAVATHPPDADSACVLAHGAGAGMDHPFMVAVAQGLAERRIACLRFQFPYMQAGKRRVDAAPVAHATVRAAVAQAALLWPALPLFAGGKSFGGRMSSQAQAMAPMPGVAGLVLLGFPLHPAGKPSADRAAHLAAVDVPLLFIHGARDALAESAWFGPLLSGLGDMATGVEVEDADHGFHVPRRSGRTDAEVLHDLLDALAMWTQAWRI